MDISKYFSNMELDNSVNQPLYLQIADHIAVGVKNKILPAGCKLPPERDLAKYFAVSRTTAINAYRHLEQRGLVTIKVGSGTYVTTLTGNSIETALPSMPWEQLFIPHLKTPLSSILRSLISNTNTDDIISLAAGMPDPALYPTDCFTNLFNSKLSQLENSNFGHIPTEGYQPLRHSIAQMETGKGIPATMDNILILAGSQQGLYLISKVLIEPGDYVVLESPTYIGAIQVFQAAGARILCLPPEEQFPFALMEDYLIRYRPKLFYTIPTFANPTGRVMPLNERQELLRLAAPHRLIIVEDDPYGELFYDEQPPASLKSLDNYGGVLYLNTFSKILFPGLRTGWLVGPPEVINRLAQEKQYVDLHCNNLTQWLLHMYLQDGNIDSHLSLVRQEYKKRRDAMVSSIRRFCKNKLTFNLPDGGFYLWCKIEHDIASQALLHEAAKTGVSFVPGNAFYTNQAGSDEIRLCFATHSPAILSEGIKRLARALTIFPQKPKNEASTDLVAGRPII